MSTILQGRAVVIVNAILEQLGWIFTLDDNVSALTEGGTLHREGQRRARAGLGDEGGSVLIVCR